MDKKYVSERRESVKKEGSALEEELAEIEFRKSVFTVGPDGCVYRIDDVDNSIFDRRYFQR